MTTLSLTIHDPSVVVITGENLAVEVRATNSPETAAGETGMVLGTGRERPLSIGLHTDGDPEARFESVSLHQNQSDGDAFAAGKGKARLANAAGVEPSPSVTKFTRSASLGAVDGRHGTPSSEAAGAKMGDCSRPDRAGQEPGHHHSNSEQAVTNSPSAAPAETGEAPSPRPASPVTPIPAKPAHGPCEGIARETPTNEPALVAPAGALGLTNQHGYEAPTPPAINPNCAHPDTCKWARSMASCSACANAAMKARAAS